MKTIELSVRSKRHKGKYFAQVDDEDYAKLSTYKWHITRSTNHIYATTAIKDENGVWRETKMHRLVLGISSPKIKVDHKDRNGLNCQKQNLRKATNSQNQMNKKPTGTSGYLGVHWHTAKYIYKTKGGQIKRGESHTWLAAINVDGRQNHIGCFKTEIEAALAYDFCAHLLHGEYANLNFKEYYR